MTCTIVAVSFSSEIGTIIEDLTWNEGSFLPNYETGFADYTPANFDSEINSTHIHIFETSGGEYHYFAGVYALVPVTDGVLSLTFEARALADIKEAVTFGLLTINSSDMKYLTGARAYDLQGEIDFAPFDTGYHQFNYRFELEGYTEVYLFFFFIDATTANWNQEVWIRNLAFEEFIDEDSPVISSSGDLFIEQSSYGNQISWTLSDSCPGTFEIYKDEELVESRGWNNLDTVSLNVDNLEIGTHTFTINVTDRFNNSAIDQTYVRVSEEPFLTIGDFDWSFGVCERDCSLPLNVSPYEPLIYDVNDTVLHVLEEGYTHDLWVGASASIPVTNGLLSLSFEGKAISDYTYAARLDVRICDSVFKQEIFNYPVILSSDIPMTDFEQYNKTFILDGYEEIILFFYFSDGWSMDWNQEFWVRNLQISINVSESILHDSYVDSYFVSPDSNPSGIVSYNDNLLVATQRTDVIHQFDSLTKEFVDSWEISGIRINNFDTNGSHFFCMEKGKSYLYILDENFNTVEILQIDVIYENGLTVFNTDSNDPYMFVGNKQTAKIYKIDLNDGSIISEITTPGPNIKGMVYDGIFLWVCDKDLRTIFRIFPENNTIVQEYQFQQINPNGICYDDDGYLWITDSSSSIFYKLNISIYDDFYTEIDPNDGTFIVSYIPATMIFIAMVITVIGFSKRRRK